VQQRVLQRDRPRHAALRRVGEQHRAALERDVLAAQGGQAERAVLVVVAGRVLLAARSEHAEVQHPHPAREHPVAAEARLAEPRDDLGADIHQPTAQREHPVVLLAVAGGAPLVVVAVLPPPGGVRADRLDVPFGSGEIHTSCQAGGITSDLIRAITSGSVIGAPDASR
jgi:hypothetical protein